MTGVVTGLFRLDMHTGPDILVGAVIGSASFLIGLVVGPPVAGTLQRSLRI